MFDDIWCEYVTLTNAKNIDERKYLCDYIEYALHHYIMPASPRDGGGVWVKMQQSINE